jgi:hypothetical protein
MKLHIGQAQLKGAFDAYASKFGLLELLAEPQRLPKLSKLRQWRASAPAGFVFSVVLSPACLGGGEEAVELLDYGLKVSKALACQWLVIRSGPELRPSAAAERRLKALVQRVREASPNVRLAWEPRGLWSGRVLERVAAELDVCPVVDVSDAEPAELLYARHRQIGVGTRTSSRRIEALALACVQSGEALVVVDGGSAAPLQRELQHLLSDFEVDDDDELDELGPDTAADGEPASDQSGDSG